MARRYQCWAYYIAFIAFVTIALAMSSAKPDPFPFDYRAMSSNYGGLLAGLGGFAITVLAVVLGLNALDVERTSPIHRAAHGVVLRHVSLSLAVASIICFIGGLMLSEVAAQASSIEGGRAQATVEISQHLDALGLSPSRVAQELIDIRGESGEIHKSVGGVSLMVSRLARDPLLSKKPTFSVLKSRAQTLDEILVASARRHLMIASVVALISSLLILKSITFLLVMRFPDYQAIGGIQDFVMLGFGSMLLIKVLHMASFGLTPEQASLARWIVPVGLATVIVTYRAQLGRRVAALRESVVQGELGRYTPAAPYLLALLVCFMTMVYLAATFGNLGMPNMIDRVLVGASALIESAMIVTIQIERPTLKLFVEAGRLGD